MNNIGPRIARAAIAQGATALLGKAGTIVSTILLARLLYPEDFGLQTIAFLVMGLANMFSNFGFQTYIIQAKELSREKLDTCYTLNILLSAALALIVAGAGFVFAGTAFQLPEMLVLYGALVFVSGLSYSQLAAMKRHLRFRESARAELGFSLTSNVGRVLFAFAGFGALCFPMGDLIGGLVRWLAARDTSSEAPRLRMPTAQDSREVIGFGAYTTSVGLASYVANQIDKALLSMSHSVASVGIYGFATTMAAMFYNAFLVPQTSVFLAAFARLQDDIEGARRLLATSSRLIFSLALPLNVLWILEAERIVTVVFGARWIEAAAIIRILSVDFLVRSMFSGFTGLQLSFGRAREAARTKWLNSGLFVALMLLAWLAKFDIRGYAMMFVAANMVALVHNVHVNGALVGFRLLPFLRNLAAPALIALAASGAWWLLLPVAGAWRPLTALAALAGTWMLVYVALTGVFNRVVITQLLMNLKKRTSK